MQEPTIGLLASAAGLAGVVWLIMQVIRPLVAPPAFDRWGAVIAMAVGIVLALLYAFVAATPAHPADGQALLQAVLVGLFGGWMSQNVNHAVTRATGS
jgi:hypothetical protein